MKSKSKASPIPDRFDDPPVDAWIRPPDPALVHTDPKRWNAEWEAFNYERYKVDSSLHVNAEAQAAQLPIFLTEGQHAYRKHMRSAILDNVVAISLDCKLAVQFHESTRGEAFEHIWSSKTREQLEENELSRAKYWLVSDDGEICVSPDAFRDKEFVEWGGQYYCEFQGRGTSEIGGKGNGILLQAHKATCGRPLTDVTDIPIFNSYTGQANPDATSSSAPTIGALLSQQIFCHEKFPGSQWAVIINDIPPSSGKSLEIFFMAPEVDTKAIELHNKYRELAFSTRGPKYIGWLFTSLALKLFPHLGSKAPQPGLEQLAAISHADFTHQFITAFEIDEEPFLDGLPTSQDLIDYQLETMPAILRDFTAGRYPHVVG
ncbi:hypothetical protein RQP46_004246 [Phenoliferia psychrophenolica]